MSVRISLGYIVAALLVSMGASQGAQGEPLRVRYAIFPGHGPLFLARDKGHFEKEGLEVQLIPMEEHTAAFAALAAGQVHVVLGTITDSLAFYRVREQPQPIACAMVLDTSAGADGVVATEDIRSIGDVEGRAVAFLKGGLTEFYLSILLAEAGLSLADIEVVDLNADDAARAFMLREVDAAVTWEPWLTKAAAVHGHVLTDTSDRPGLLNDCILTTVEAFERRKADFRALARAWFAALADLEADPQGSIAIMASGFSEGLNDPQVLAEALEGIRIFDRQANEEFFGTPSKPGPIYKVARHAIDMFRQMGVLQFEMEPSDLVIHGILDE